MHDQTGLSRRDVLKLAGGAALGAAVSGISRADEWQFKLPELPYAEDALEPYIDARTMGIHHGKHHAGYTNKLNAAIEGTDLAGMSIEDILGNLDAAPEDIRTAVRKQRRRLCQPQPLLADHEPRRRRRTQRRPG